MGFLGVRTASARRGWVVRKGRWRVGGLREWVGRERVRSAVGRRVAILGEGGLWCVVGSGGGEEC